MPQAYFTFDSLREAEELSHSGPIKKPILRWTF